MVCEEQIQQWADEAEAGYDVDEMKRHGRGRPGRGAEPMQVVAVRLTAEELAAVDAIAEREHTSRSEAIRKALAGCQLWIEPIDEEGWPHRDLRLGFDSQARLLEIVVLSFASGDEMVIHTMPARKQYWELLP